MRKLLLAGVLFLFFSCGSGTKSENNKDTSVPGNSSGSNTISADTMHIDTSSKGISTKH